MLSPGLAIFVTVLAFNLFGDGLRDALDPRIALTRSRGRSRSTEENGYTDDEERARSRRRRRRA